MFLITIINLGNSDEKIDLLNGLYYECDDKKRSIVIKDG